MWKNAFAYVTRQKFKSLLLALIIMVMATLSLLSLSLRSAVKAAGRNNFKNITNSFSLQINRYYNQGTARGAGNIKVRISARLNNRNMLLLQPSALMPSAIWSTMKSLILTR